MHAKELDFFFMSDLMEEKILLHEENGNISITIYKYGKQEQVKHREEKKDLPWTFIFVAKMNG